MTDNQNTETASNWYDKPIKRAFAILSGFVFVASMGYSIAIIQKNLEFKLERYELRQEYNQKLQEQIFKCEKEKQEVENKRVDALEKAMLQLQNNYNEK